MRADALVILAIMKTITIIAELTLEIPDDINEETILLSFDDLQLVNIYGSKSLEQKIFHLGEDSRIIKCEITLPSYPFNDQKNFGILER